MAKVKRLEKNIILAQLLERWARKYKVLNDHYVQDLLKALVEKNNLAFWATLNPFDLLPSPVPIRSEATARAARIVNAWRNGLVFAPVALTWIAVSKATAAFQIYTDRNLNATVNFLQFWQNGYGILSKEWAIGTIAMLDALIVFIVITLTVISNTLNLRAKKIDDQENEVIIEERLQIAIAIKEFLYSKQTISRLTLNQGIATAIENLVEVTEKLKRRRK